VTWISRPSPIVIGTDLDALQILESIWFQWRGENGLTKRDAVVHEAKADCFQVGEFRENQLNGGRGNDAAIQSEMLDDRRFRAEK
jgi:hypothetical protein